MPTYTVQGPDGKDYSIDGPTGATQEQVVSAIKEQLSRAHSAVVAQNPTDGNSFLQNAAIGVGKAFTDIGQGAGQILRSGIEKVGGDSGHSMADSIGLPTEADVAEKRRMDAPIMDTVGGKVGNFVGTAVPAVASAFVPGAQGLAGTLLTGAATGALEPVASGESRLKNAAVGAAGAGAGYGLAKGISRVVSPNASTNPALQMLQDEGVNPTIGQTLGGTANKLEQKLTSVPILGDAIQSARGRAAGEFNNAAINRATAPIGVKIEGSGQEAVQAAGDALSHAYNNVLGQIPHVTLDSQFAQDLTQLQGMATNLVPDMAKKFDKTLKDVVLSRVSPQGSMLGDVYKTIDSDLGTIASRFGKSQVASEQEFGESVFQLKNLLKQQMERSNPQVADTLNAIDYGWANLVRVEGAAKSAKQLEGVFSPAQLNMAIQAADDSVRKRAVSRGTALMQDLGNAGQSVLGNTVPDSGTAGRTMAGIGALATGFLHPAIPVGLAAGSAAYTPAAQKILNAAVSARPAIAEPIGAAIANLANPAGLSGAVMTNHTRLMDQLEAYRKKKDQERISTATNVDQAIQAAQDSLN